MDNGTSPDNATPRLTEAQLALLQAVIDEPSLTAAADQIGYSTRHTRRLAQQLTTTLGVDTIRQAIAVAVAQGWVSYDRHLHAHRSASPEPVRATRRTPSPKINTRDANP